MVTPPNQWIGDTSHSPITGCSIGAIVCAYLAIGIMGAYLPRAVPLAWPIGFLVASVAFTIAVVLLLSRTRLPWGLFLAVVRWTILVTLVFSCMGVYIFIHNGTPGRTLAVMAAVLLLSAVNLPMLIGFSVARHERPDH